MDKLRELYDEFYSISKTYLEKETGQQTDSPDFEVDVTTLMSIVPILEKKVCCISQDITNEQVLRLMRHCNYQVFSFWFMRSDAVVKSVYNKLTDDMRDVFVCLFKDMLTVTQTVISLNNMYNNIRQETADIVADSKKILEIIASMRSLSGEGKIYNLLQSHFVFIVKTINKILSDKNYLLKLVAVFDSDLVANKDKLDEYRQLLTISTEGLIYGIQCVSDITMDIPIDQNKYTLFLKKVLANVLLFQNNSSLNPNKFITAVSKLYILIHDQLRDNEDVRQILTDVLESLKTKVSVDDIKSKGIKNLQSLIGYISNNKTMYRSLIETEYITREKDIICTLQQIIVKHNVCINDKLVDIETLISSAKQNFFSKLTTNI
ncbi:Virion morphogenesis [Sea otter poxvirus]|uniref:Virion morphogenesis n=1 Tax=Sea otter poxvirus TaxID=1416741 RepID=A0A2U9QHR5_9POXV|nr:Virion morphogenesis [Sea otter poxvirus]AWU47140.1 Virion morphogenesis [Sea otter poxvirus]